MEVRCAATRDRAAAFAMVLHGLRPDLPQGRLRMRPLILLAALLLPLVAKVRLGSFRPFPSPVFPPPRQLGGRTSFTVARAARHGSGSSPTAQRTRLARPPTPYDRLAHPLSSPGAAQGAGLG